MVGMIVAILILLLFFAALYMSSKNWHLAHVLLLFGIFAMTATFTMLAAMSLKTHEAWKTQHQRLTKDIETTQTEIALLEVGDTLHPDGTPETILALKERLALQLVDRGRVWRGVSPAGVGEGSVGVDMTGWGGMACYGKEIPPDEVLEPEPEPELEPVVDDPVDTAADGVDGATDELAPSPDEDPRGATADDEDPGADAGPSDDAAAPEAGDIAAPEPVAPRSSPAPGGGVDSGAHNIEAGMVLYAFLEGSSRELPPAQQKALFGQSELPQRDVRGACRVPVYYLGSFLVKSARGNAVELAPVLPLDPQQTRWIGESAQRRGTWSLLEVMPVDGHDLATVKAPWDASSIAPDFSAEDLAGLFPNSPFTQNILAEYGRDLTAVGGVPPQQAMVKVKFKQPHEVKVDAEEATEAMEGSFDSEGRAVLSYLAQGSPTQFAEGDELWIHGDVAAKWASEGICERTADEPIFVRPLRNYDTIYHQAFDQSVRVGSEMQLFTQDNATITAAAAKARLQIEFREAEMGKLKQDASHLGAELELLSRYRTALEKQYGAQRQMLSRLYRWNSQTADGLRGPVQVTIGR